MRTRDTVIVCVTILAFAGFFWPGLYRYDRLGSGENSVETRTNRLTLQTEALTANGWFSLSTPSAKQESGQLSVSDRSKITGTGGFQYGGSFYAMLYNGSPWTVTEIEYRIKSKNPTAAKSRNPVDSLLAIEWDRTFRSTVYLEPLSSADDFFTVGAYSTGHSAEWTIVSAKGFKTTK